MAEVVISLADKLYYAISYLYTEPTQSPLSDTITQNIRGKSVPVCSLNLTGQSRPERRPDLT